MAKNKYTGPGTSTDVVTANSPVIETTDITSYPKWMYHATLPAVVVGGPDEQGALGEGWKESPAGFGAVEVEAVPEPEPEAAPEPVIEEQKAE